MPRSVAERRAVLGGTRRVAFVHAVIVRFDMRFVRSSLISYGLGFCIRHAALYLSKAAHRVGAVA